MTNGTMKTMKTMDKQMYFAELAKEAKKIKERALAFEDENGKHYVYEQEDLTRIKEINSEVLAALDNYFHDTLHKQYGSYLKIYNDLYNECVACLFEKFPIYNGKTTLTTFIRPYINMAINTYIGNDKGLSRYYNEKANIIRKAIRTLEQDKITPTISEIKKLIPSDISEKTVKRILEMENQIMVSDDTALLEKSSETFKSPEEMLIEAEEAEFVKTVLDSLYPYERIAYKMFNNAFDEETGMFDNKENNKQKKRPTYATIGQHPNLITAVYLAGKSNWMQDGCLPALRVEEIVRTARKKINMHPLVMAAVDSSRMSYGEEIKINANDAITQNINILIKL